MSKDDSKAVVEVTPEDVNPSHGTIYCPNPKMPLWSGHPRVFLEIASTGRAACPYCGTVYELHGAARVNGAGH